MKKLKLEMDELRVESFDAGSGDGRGTVAGRDWSAESCDPCEPLPEPREALGFVRHFEPGELRRRRWQWPDERIARNVVQQRRLVEVAAVGALGRRHARTRQRGIRAQHPREAVQEPRDDADGPRA